MQTLVLVVGLAVLAMIGWALLFHFDRRTTTWALAAVSLVSALNVFVFARSLVRTRQDPPRLLAALILLVLAAGLFVWAIRASRDAALKLIYAEDRPRQILEAGPYRFIRHPFYASYILYWLGCAVAAMLWVNWAYMALLLPALVYAARVEEAGFARSPIAADYAAYKKRAGLFWPRLWGGG